MCRLPSVLVLAIPGVAAAASPGWLLDGVGQVEGAPADLPLYRGVLEGGLPMVQGQLPLSGAGGSAPPAARQVFAVVDLMAGPTRIGADLVAEAGLSTEVSRDGAGWLQTVTLPELRLVRPDADPLVLRDVRAEVVSGGGLVLGVGTVDELAVAILPSEGVVRFVPAADGGALLDGLGEALPVARQALGARWKEHGVSRVGDGLSGSVPAVLDVEGAEEVRVAIRTDRTWTALEPGLAPTVGAVDGLRRALLSGALGGAPLGAAVAVVHGGLADPDPAFVASLGYDALAGLDLAVAGERLAVRTAEAPTWQDPGAARIEEAERRYAAWREAHPDAGDADRPPKMTFGAKAVAPQGADPGDPFTLALHQQLADVLWAEGRADLAVQRSLDASAAAGDRCLPHLVLGQRRLRTAGGRLTASFVGELVRQPLVEAGTLYGRWAELAPRVRERIRSGRSVPDGTFTIEQPDDCRAAWGTLMGAWLAADAPDRLAALYEAHRGADRTVPQLMGVALLAEDPAAAEARLREALSRGGRSDVALRLALAAAQVALDRSEPAHAWLGTLPYRDAEHPLTAALVASSLGAPPPEAILPLPGVVAAWVVHAARGGEIDETAVEGALQAVELRRPADPSVEALRAVWSQRGGIDLPLGADRAHLADTWAARILKAELAGDAEARAVAVDELRRRYPELPIAAALAGETSGGDARPGRGR